MELKTVLVATHLLGVVLGVGGALFLDVYLLRLMRGAPVAAEDVAFARFVSRFVKIGLCLLWATGLAILATAVGGPASVVENPKVQAKIVIVVVLTLNGLFIESKALPLLRQNVGQPLFHGVGDLARGSFLLLTAISSVSWAMPVVLGVASELNHVMPAAVILSFYLAFIVAGIAIANLAFLLLYRPAAPVAAPRVATTRGSGPRRDDVALLREPVLREPASSEPASSEAAGAVTEPAHPARASGIRQLDIVGLKTLLAREHAA